jgi:hypothetical protein
LWVPKEISVAIAIKDKGVCLCVHVCPDYNFFKFCHSDVFLTLHLLLHEIRTLFKFMKKFEAVLSEPCQSCLVESDKEEQPDCLPKPTEEATMETSPIQGLNNALRETLLAQPVEWKVLACGVLCI